MIAMLQGKVAGTTLHHIILDVNGVGYLIAVRNPLDFKLQEVAQLHTHLAVRENALDLYGFLTRDELSMFDMLIDIPKIGPKSALQILIQAEISLIKESVIKNDAVYLSKMSGMGKKTAEKIVLELKDKFESYGEGGTTTPFGTHDTDIIDALISLGYTERDARETLKQISPEIEGTNARIKEALKLLSS